MRSTPFVLCINVIVNPMEWLGANNFIGNFQLQISIKFSLSFFSYDTLLQIMLCPNLTHRYTTTKLNSFPLKNKGVCHNMALPFTLKSILRQKKKNYGNSNILPCKNIIFKKSSKRNQNPSTYYNSISSFNTSQNTIFQKSSYKNRPIVTQGSRTLKL